MYHLFIVTPEKIVFDGMVSILSAPGTIGYLEILTDHAPIITTLTAGKLEIKNQEDHKIIWAISGGILKVSHNEAIVLGDAVELASEINLERAKLALEKAEKRIIIDGNEVETARAKKAVLRAQNRIKIAQSSSRF